MTKQDAIDYINEADTPEERQLRKLRMHSILYSQPKQIKDDLTKPRTRN